MDVEEFIRFIRSDSPTSIAEALLFKSHIHVLPSEEDYIQYKNMVIADHVSAHHVAVVGSGNWKFSLAPEKNLKEFHEKSDIDIAIICAESYLQTWDELRKHHRDNYYTLNHAKRQALKRFGENVYSGFATPKWMPSLRSELKQRYQKLTNKYSTREVGYKSVNMMYFRNTEEAIDYYVRGIRNAIN